MALKDKVKTALDETRLLILGSQILFGFQFNGMFQDAFDRLSGWSRGLDATGFFLMALTIGCLIAPSMQHQLVEQGNDSVRLHRATTRFAAIALVPFSVSLGIAFFLVLEHHVGTRSAAAGWGHLLRPRHSVLVRNRARYWHRGEAHEYNIPR
jgi:Family of unknown function (DUF6328)